VARPPVEELEAGAAFYSEIAPDLDVSHFGAMWHTFTVGHMVATDLDRVARRHGVSIADLHVLGTLRIERKERLRATDLALTLHVSNAALSARIAKLESKGLLIRAPSPADRRAFELQLTPAGAALAEAAIGDISRNAAFIRYFRRLTVADRAALGRIMGELHNLLDRDFVPAKRKDA
jgi:DNA-binding MarR family transcriptional regulator